MNTFAVIALVAFVASTNAGVLVEPSAKILQGPSSRTTLVGPEGSIITAAAPGGQIVHEEHPGYVAHAAPVVPHAAPVVAHHAASIYAHAAPVVAHHTVPVVAHAQPATVVAHSSAYQSDNVVVAGPSGTIASGNSHTAPVIAHASPIVAHAAAVVAHAGIFTHADVDDNGHEGQYVHDYNEALYDDGSYKPHH